MTTYPILLQEVQNAEVHRTQPTYESISVSYVPIYFALINVDTM